MTRDGNSNNEVETELNFFYLLEFQIFVFPINYKSYWAMSLSMLDWTRLPELYFLVPILEIYLFFVKIFFWNRNGETLTFKNFNVHIKILRLERSELNQSVWASPLNSENKFRRLICMNLVTVQEFAVNVKNSEQRPSHDPNNFFRI